MLLTEHTSIQTRHISMMLDASILMCVLKREGNRLSEQHGLENNKILDTSGAA